MNKCFISFLSPFALIASMAIGAEPLPTATATAQLAAERATVRSAHDAARRDDPIATEQFIVSMNKSTLNSSAWHVETAQRLIQLAHDVPRQGPRGKAIPALVASALQHLNQAEGLTTNARERASIKALAGLIHERYLGDHTAALTNYRAAAVLAPENAIAVKAAARLQRTAEVTASRAKK